jgi:hypothetical protein
MLKKIKIGKSYTAKPKKISGKVLKLAKVLNTFSDDEQVQLLYALDFEKARQFAGTFEQEYSRRRMEEDV